MLSFLLNLMYQTAEGRPDLQRLIVGAAQGFNDRMAEINHTEPVKALLTESVDR